MGAAGSVPGDKYDEELSKPLDASDCTDLDAAKQEISRLRRMMSDSASVGSAASGTGSDAHDAAHAFEEIDKVVLALSGKHFAAATAGASAAAAPEAGATAAAAPEAGAAAAAAAADNDEPTVETVAPPSPALKNRRKSLPGMVLARANSVDVTIINIERRVSQQRAIATAAAALHRRPRRVVAPAWRCVHHARPDSPALVFLHCLPPPPSYAKKMGGKRSQRGDGLVPREPLQERAVRRGGRVPAHARLLARRPHDRRGRLERNRPPALGAHRRAGTSIPLSLTIEAGLTDITGNRTK